MKKSLLSVLIDLTLVFAVLAVVWCFNYADECRKIDATGGEVFTIALPLMIVFLKAKMVGQKSKQNR